MASSSNPTSYTIGGVPVKYPYKAYPAQLALMDKIIRSVAKGQNCLLESPTGSGKTLALLCSTLAWQQAEYAKIRSEVRIHNVPPIVVASAVGRDPSMASVAGKCVDNDCECASPLKGSSTSSSTYSGNQSHPRGHDSSRQQTEEVLASANVKGIGDKDDAAAAATVFAEDNDSDANAKDFYCDDADDFKPAKRQRYGPITLTTVAKGSIAAMYLMERKMSCVEYISTSAPLMSPSLSPCAGGNVNPNETTIGGTSTSQPAAEEAPPRKWVPTIYYGTRTHKQIKQIIRELKKTAYKDVKMCILASRETTCIHDTIAHEPGKNEACKNLLKSSRFPGGGCSYFLGAGRFKSMNQLIYSGGLTSAWDIEDLVQLGRQKSACPYYIINNVKNGADIVFCPYNHLIDPLVRERMGINLEGNILILDEAHNIEDVGREAASFSVSAEELSETVKNLQIIGDSLEFEYPEDNYFLKLSAVVAVLHGWLTLNSNNLADDSVNQSSLVVAGREAMAAFEDIGIGREPQIEFLRLVTYVDKFLEDTNGESANDNEQQADLQVEVSEEKKSRTLAAKVLPVLEGLSMIFNNFSRSEQRFLDDYKVSILKTLSTKTFKAPMDQFVNRHSASLVLSLNFWCLNPAVSFVCIKEKVRSIVLTSGTLAPTDSFQSELHIPFPIKLETNHVIDKSQVWVGAIGVGPSCMQLQGTYVNTETFAFQDEIGKVVFQICKTVPHGVLLFVSSYYFIEKLQNRWQATGMWEEISQHKSIFCEERGSNKTKFDETLANYYEVVTTGVTISKSKSRRKTSMETVRTVNGALLIAVFRGKVSEGMDFADNFARAVITCGIPYPGVKDLQVALKRRYNDTRVQSHGLLSGQKWYEIQAFRAVNQALGRCIRHRNDWGALILIDSRFSNSAMYTNSLSKWIRGNLQRYNDFDCAMDSLHEFIALQTNADDLWTLRAKQEETEKELERTVVSFAQCQSSAAGESSPGQIISKPLDKGRNKSQWLHSRKSYVPPKDYFTDDVSQD